MTALINIVVVVAGLRSHTSKLGKFFVMPLALRIPIFNKKSHPTLAVERLKNSIVVKLLQWEDCVVPQFVSDHIFC